MSYIPHTSAERQNIYLVCEDMDFVWDERDVLTFDSMWQDGLCVTDIARAFKRDADEVVILAIDRARQGMISPRKNGLYGRRMPEGVGT